MNSQINVNYSQTKWNNEMHFLPQLMQYVWHGLKPCVELEVLSAVHIGKKIGLKTRMSPRKPTIMV